MTLSTQGVPNSERSSVFEAIGKLTIALTTIAVALALIPLDMLLDAWTMRALWGWFIVPAFHVAPLAFSTAAGIGLIVALQRGWPRSDPGDEKRSDGEKAIRSLCRVIINPTFFWCLGWVLQRVVS